MTESKKCFCDLYRQASSGEVEEIPVGPTSEVWDADKFIEDADKICPGTSVFMARAALRSDDITIDEDTITFPKDAVTLQCEYFATLYRGV